MNARLKRFAIGVAVVVIGVTIGKIAQYAAVDYFGASLGFDLASAIGVIPVVLIFVWLSHRYPVLHWRRGANG